MEEPPQKISRNIDFIEFENDAIQKCETPVDSTPHWNYDILRAIFQYLPAKDLDNTAKVCRSWLEAAHKEKQTRKYPDYIIRSSPELQLESVWIEPFIGFHFITLPLTNRLQHHTFPRNYDSMIFEVSSIIVEEDHEDDTKIIFRSSPDIFYVLSVHLPQIPYVHISTSIMNVGRHPPVFHIINTHPLVVDMKTLEKFVNKLKIARTSKQNHENSVCFMLFCDNNIGWTNAHNMIATLSERFKKERVTIWGGAVERIYSKQVNKVFCHPEIAVVAISGLMESWSVAVKTTWPANEVENRLAIFKDKVKLKKYSIGFVFVSSYLSLRLNKSSKEDESTIFKRLFPQVPLVGCEGRNFVFGINIDPLSEADEQEKYKRKHGLSSVEMRFISSVFMILTYD